MVRRMGLRLLAGPTSLTAVVRWVAVSELADPTPYLEGDELLLTTGMRLEADVSRYVARLVARGVAGLGFGVGVSHEEVPPALVEAADQAGLPLLEVPRETPFIAIGKAVSELLAAEQYEEITRAFAAQGRLTRAALRPEGMHAVIDRLAKEVGGWAALLDETGEVRHATRGAPTHAVTAELTRLRTGRPPAPERAEPQSGRSERVAPVGTGERAAMGPRPGPARPAEPGHEVRWPAGEGRVPASLALSGPGEHIVVQPLGGGVRPRGFFAVGAEQPFSPVTHTVINAAGSLLTLAVEQGRTHLAAERRARSAVLALLLAGAADQAQAVLTPLGGRLPEAPLLALAADAGALDTLETHAFTAILDDAVGAGVATEPMAVALVPEAAADLVALEVDGPVGISLRSGYDPASLRGALDQARRALAAARSRPAPAVRFGELAGQGLLGLLDPSAAQAFAAALLAPLTEYGSRADLVESLRAYLDCNGHWDAAAQRLGVHRHTLRYRMKRVAELLGRDLDDPGVRAELWLALQATASAPGSSRWSPW
ncbi:PucR family transcriptional regulator [Nonomuraea turcica]|uniref:PucR family transcriptional regulator n=1 Tax=Nonomuraea sp. G32 TaxID=3067274 RepID=UPI00273CA8B4|nr:PucR family transcriptional regulator [Nonomuraea sp. G32]MDP4511593.1 PucR family transcriptional regulator [Nonomuraea sp. G32]